MSDFLMKAWEIAIVVVATLMVVRFFHACNTLDEINRQLQLLGFDLKDKRPTTSASSQETRP